ncbi:MAG TPA: hypothetical protein PLY51_13510 [Microthrixaceae bacterium]|nr:hypothetical protein [Microthrixaceae bacterium]
MSADVIQFVDSIDAKPVVRLDLNDDDVIRCRTFLAPPPRLRRSMSQNVMTDGGFVSSSQYGTRVLYIDLDLITTSQDENAAYLQKLARELDRATNIIRYQPAGASRPVFFKVWRSDFSALVDMKAVLAFRQASLEIVAEPFAYGLRETISPGTVSNDPAAANGGYIDITGVIGDVEAEPVITFGTDITAGDMLHLATLPNPDSAVVVAVQAESMTLEVATSNPGGGPDAAMSGTGTNNYVRSTSGAVARRVTYTSPSNTVRQAMVGDWRCWVVARKTVGVSADRVKSAFSSESTSYLNENSFVTMPTTTNRQLVDLGIVSFGDTDSDSPSQVVVSVMAELANSVDWDYIYLTPAQFQSTIIGGVGIPAFNTVDSTQDRVYRTLPTVGDIFTSTAYWSGIVPFTGALPRLYPNVTNRLYWHTATPSTSTPSISKTKTAVVSVYYHPRYLYVRPVSS